MFEASPNCPDAGRPNAEKPSIEMLELAWLQVPGLTINRESVALDFRRG
jgi:hypothetical protein